MALNKSTVQPGNTNMFDSHNITMMHTARQLMFYTFSVMAILLFSGCSTQSVNNYADSTIPTCNTQQPQKNVTLNSNIRVLSWNIYKGKKANWEKDLIRLTQPSDIALLQEAALALIPPLPSHRSMAFSPGYKDGQLQTGVLTLSSHAASTICQLKHQEPWLRTPKASLITYYSISGSEQSLLVANMHGINFTFGVKAYKKQLSDLAKIIQEHQGPVILGGDLNSWNNRRNKAITNAFNALKLEKVEFASAYRTMFLGHPLDHFFYRGLSVQSRRVHNLDTSDHNPIEVTFKLLGDTKLLNKSP